MRTSILGFVLLLIGTSLSAQNLIKNGSCDSALVGGKIPYWQEITGNGWSQRTADPVPFKGVGYFYPPSVADASLGQTIALNNYRTAIDSGVLKLRFIGYVLSYSQVPADESNIVITFSDSATSLSTYSFGPYNQTTAWFKIDSMLSAPIGTRSVNIMLHSVRRAGTNNDGYYDELSLMPVIQCLPKTFSVTPDSVSVCKGGQVHLCGPAGYKAYTWNFATTGICLQVNDTGTYRLAALDTNDCPISSPPVPVTQLVLTPVDITIATDTLCSGDSTEICAPAGYTSYEWNRGATTECIQAKQIGNYYLTVTDNNGCSVESVHKALFTYPTASVSIVVKGDTLTSFGAVAYQWYLNDTLIEGATSTMYIAKTPGSYSVRITDGNGCNTRSSAVQVAVITSIRDKEVGIFSVYPNPSAAGMQLSVSSEMLGEKMELYDVQGRPVFQSVIEHLRSDISLPAIGVYFLRVSTPTGQQVHKLVRL